MRWSGVNEVSTLMTLGNYRPDKTSEVGSSSQIDLDKAEGLPQFLLRAVVRSRWDRHTKASAHYLAQSRSSVTFVVPLHLRKAQELRSPARNAETPQGLKDWQLGMVWELPDPHDTAVLPQALLHNLEPESTPLTDVNYDSHQENMQRLCVCYLIMWGIFILVF